MVDHISKVEAVLRSLREAVLTANPEKCFIGLKEAKYLGYIVGGGVVRPQVSKIDALKNWPTPHTKKPVCARIFSDSSAPYRFDKKIGTE